MQGRCTMTRLGSEHLGDMSDEGQRVRERRERLGVDKKELAEAAGVNRNTLAAIEAGESFNRSSLAKIERALEALELEAGIKAPPRGAAAAAHGSGELIEFDIAGDFGVHLVVRGPVGDAEVLKRQVVDIIREIRKSDPNHTDPRDPGS